MNIFDTFWSFYIIIYYLCIPGIYRFLHFKHVFGRCSPKSHLFCDIFIKIRMKLLILKFISEKEIKNTTCYHGWIILTESASIISNVEKCNNGQYVMDSNLDFGVN